MKFSILFLSGLMFLIVSCQSKKTFPENTETNMSQADSKMQEDGFKKATVVYSEIEGDCPFTFSVEGETTLYDPVNLEEKYRDSHKKIWVKFRPLRMANRCDKANPVEIIEISLRN